MSLGLSNDIARCGSFGDLVDPMKEFTLPQLAISNIRLMLVVMGRQLSLFSGRHMYPPRKEHGGEIRRGRRKLARPFDSRRPIHVVLRSSVAKGRWSLRRPDTTRQVFNAMQRLARRFGVRVYEFANATNHLHMLIRAKCRHALQGFLRAFAGIAARIVTGAQKGRPIGKFWDWLAYSRIVEWGRDFFGAWAYVFQNELEGTRRLPHQPRGARRVTRGPPR
jgi:REP element-mobilizing transposase RayT